MNIAVAILTWEPIRTGRVELLKQTLDSLEVEGVQGVIVNNNSQDRSEPLIERMACPFFEVHHSDDLNHTSAHGNNLGVSQVIARFSPDIVVLSDDDMLWKPDWWSRLSNFWIEAPEHVKLAGCHLEPETYAWSPILGQDDIGGEHCLYRGSTGAASWSFRVRDWPFIGPLSDATQGHGDILACARVVKQGFQIAQLDLAEHVGAGDSSWGNRSYAMYGKTLDREKWGFR